MEANVYVGEERRIYECGDICKATTYSHTQHSHGCHVEGPLDIYNALYTFTDMNYDLRALFPRCPSNARYLHVQAAHNT